MRKTWVLAVLLFTAASGSSGFAATRIMQFTGVAGGEFTVGEVSNRNNVAYCVVAVVNTGKESQRITNVEFMDYDFGAQRTSGNAWIGPDHALFRSSTAATGSCIGTVLPEGAVCLFRFATSPLSADGRYIVCGGRITVADVAADKPGSITASGAVSFIQEAKVLGGVLSGAYYASGSHSGGKGRGDLKPTPNVRYDVNYPADVTRGSHQMNFYCARACEDHGGSVNFCVAHCGQDGACGGAECLSTPVAYWDLQDDNWTYNYIVDPPYARTMPIYDAVDSTITGGSCGAQSHSAFALNPTPDSFKSNPYPSLLRTSNSHYAFGMVYEMVIGPLTSICSGIVAFEEQGGQDFTHADSVDYAVIVEGGTSGGPPENLICSHRHAMDDLYMGVGSSSTFPINGGNAF